MTAISNVIFVCLGNICRSPMAEGVFSNELARRGMTGITVDSAGIGGWHTGNFPDQRAIDAAATRGIDISHQRARQIVQDDFQRFDIVVAMDKRNYAALHGLAPQDRQANVMLLLEFADDQPGREVLDPYYDADEEFERCLDLLAVGARGLADHIARSRS